jgi:hypothetical protein
MLSLVSILVGVVFLLGFSLWLWFLLNRPTRWARFTEEENAFWVKRGLPIKWAGACKEFEHGRGLKVLLAFCIFVALALTVTPFVLPILFPHRD